MMTYNKLLTMIYSGGDPQNYIDPTGLSPRACLADVLFNFAVGQIPGVPLLQALDFIPLEFQPFQGYETNSGLVNFDPGFIDLLKGGTSGAQVYHGLGYGIAGGDFELNRTAELIGRGSFAGHSPGYQAKMLDRMAELSRLKNLAKLAGRATQVLNVLDALNGIRECLNNCQAK